MNQRFDGELALAAKSLGVSTASENNITQLIADRIPDAKATSDAMEKLFRNEDTRELFYATVLFCCTSRTRAEVEDRIAAHPAFSKTILTPSACVDILMKKGALAASMRLADGSEVSLDEFIALIEGEQLSKADGEMTLLATTVALETVAAMSVSNRLSALLKESDSDRKQIYREVLQFCSEPRTLSQIEAILKEMGYFTSPTKDTETVYPSNIASALARTGALQWQNGWVLTEEGAEAINEKHAEQKRS